MPRLLGEVIAVWLTAGCAYVLNQYILPADVDSKIKERTPYFASVSHYPILYVSMHFGQSV